jgi:dienelactone hydrolase
MNNARRRTLSALIAVGASLPVLSFGAEDIPQPEEVTIRVKPTPRFPDAVKMYTLVYKPGGAGPFPVLIYSHGRAVDKDDRQALEHPIPSGHVRFWLRKGFAVVAPIRPGYGETGGPDRETSGARFNKNGSCTTQPDYVRPAEAAAAAVLASIDWVHTQRWARRDAIVLEGTSVGGMTTVAVAARNPQGVIGYINFAGGAGGNPELAPGKSCGPQFLSELYGQFGKTTRVPGIWLYASNDQFWGPRAPRQWHDSFAAGGSHSEFIQTGPVPDADGHQLMQRGGRMWSVHVNRFVGELGFR